MSGNVSGMVLQGYCNGLESAPYTYSNEYSDRHDYVFPVRPKVLLGIAAIGSMAHYIKDAAAVVINGKTTYGARWACGSNSVNAIFLADITDFPHIRMCPQCADRQPLVYRCFSKAGELLYIGCTVAYRTRMRQHVSDSPWWPLVADIQRQRFDSHIAALIAERHAIETEHPVHNRLHCNRRAA